jgi:hypothetical protein
MTASARGTCSFQSTPVWRATPAYTGYESPWPVLQSTPSCGRRFLSDERVHQNVVSIHAPVGGDRSSTTGTCRAISFNPRPPAWGETIYVGAGCSRRISAPCSEQHARCCNPLSCKVSSDAEATLAVRAAPVQVRSEAVDLFGSKPVELIQAVGAIGT